MRKSQFNVASRTLQYWCSGCKGVDFHIPSILVFIGCFSSENLQITASRLMKRPVPLKSMSFWHTSLYLDSSLKKRSSFLGLLGLMTSCSPIIHHVEASFFSDLVF